MNFSRLIATRWRVASKGSFSSVIIRIAVVAVALSVTVMLLADAIVIGFQKEIKEKITAFNGEVQIAKTSSVFALENEPLTIEQEAEDLFYSTPGVKAVHRIAIKPGVLKTDDEAEGVVLKGVDDSYSWNILKKVLVAGEPLEYRSDTSRGAIIPMYLSQKLGLKLQDTLTIFFIARRPTLVRLYVQGIYQTNIEEIDRNFIMSDLRLVQRENGWDSTSIGSYEVHIDDIDNATEVAEELHAIIPFDQNASSIVERFPQIFDWLELLDKNPQIILTLMALVAAINMITALIIMIFERTALVGLFKALGATNWQIQKVFILNAARVVGVGVLVGLGIALLIMGIQNYFDIISLDPTSYYVTAVPMEFLPLHIIGIVAAAFIFCTVALVVPSLIILNIKPARALRWNA